MIAASKARTALEIASVSHSDLVTKEVWLVDASLDLVNVSTDVSRHHDDRASRR